jgi:hypothetical protein
VCFSIKENNAESSNIIGWGDAFLHDGNDALSDAEVGVHFLDSSYVFLQEENRCLL